MAAALLLGPGLAPAQPPPQPAVSATPAVCLPAGRCTLVAEAGWLQLQEGAATLARWPLQDAQGRSGGLLAGFEAPARRSFIVVLSGLAELWEISVDPQAEPLYDGLVHDHRLGEGIARPGYLGLRRTRLARPWSAVFFDTRMPWLVGAEAGEGGAPPAQAVVLHLDIRREVLRLGLDARRQPPLQGTALERSADASRWRLKLPANDGRWQWVDTQRWTVLPAEGALPDQTD